MLGARDTVRMGGEGGRGKEVLAGAGVGVSGGTGRGGQTGGEGRLAGVVAALEARLRDAQGRLGEADAIRRTVQEQQENQGKRGKQGKQGKQGKREALKRLSEEQRESLGRIEVEEQVVRELEGVCALVRAALEEERREHAVAVEEEEKVEKVEKVENQHVERSGSNPVDAVGAGVVECQVSEAVKKMVHLMYCACLFDPFVPYQVEKAAMLAWMHRTQDVDVHVGLPRFAEMLDAIGVLGKMISRRPLGEGKSHEESVRYCEDVALRYVLGGEETLLGWSGFMTKAQVQGALEQIMTSEYFRNEGMVYRGGGGARPEMHQVATQPRDEVVQPLGQSLGRTSVGVEKGQRAKVSTPSPAQDQVGMSLETSEGTDSSSDHAEEESEVEVEMEVEAVHVELGEKKHPESTVEASVELATEQPSVEPANTGSQGEATAVTVKRKSSGGKKKGKGGQGKALLNTSSPMGADRGVQRDQGKSKGVIETKHSVLPQRVSRKNKNKNNS